MSWRETTFEDLYAEKSRNGIYKPRQFHGEGAKIVNMGELFAYRAIGPQPMARLQVEQSEEERFGLRDGDLLFARRSLVESGAGKCVIVDGLDEPTVFESSLIRVRLDPARCDPRFYFYYFGGHPGRGRIEAIITGVAQKGIRGSELARVSVHDPPLPVQRGIADILSAYDDLIENNNRRMALLEESIHLLYREWFVYLRFPGHERRETVDGLPRGWRDECVNYFGEVVTGKTPSKKVEENYGGEVPFVKTPDMHGQVHVVSTTDSLTPKGAATQPNKALPEGSVMVSCIGTVGVVSIAPAGAHTNQQINTIVLKRPIERYFCFCAMKDLEPLLKKVGGGVATPIINKANFCKLPVRIPTPALMSLFDEVASPVFDEILTLQRCNQTLIDARDLILPRLMDGRVPV